MPIRFAADASGTDHRNAVIAVAGYIIEKTTWGQIADEWNSVLAAHGLRYLHMREFGTKHCSVGTGSWSKDKQNRLLVKCADLIQSGAKRGIAFCVEKDIYERIVTTSTHADAWGPPGSGCSQTCMGYVENWAERIGYTGPIEYLFERGDRRHEIQHAYSELKRQAEARGHGERTLEAGDKSEVSLQAADLIAYQVRDVFEQAHGDELLDNISENQVSIVQLSRLFTPVQRALFRPNGIRNDCFLMREEYLLSRVSLAPEFFLEQPKAWRRRTKAKANQNKRIGPGPDCGGSAELSNDNK